MAPPELTILIVDDDEPTRELYARMLSPHYRVLACVDASSARGMLRAEPIAAAVVEPALPADDGWDLLTLLRQRAIPVILCSTTEQRRRGMSLGAAAYLVKPVMPMALLDLIRQLLAVV